MKREFSSPWQRAACQTRLLLAILTLCLPLSLLAQEGFASLEEQMTGDEFRSAGLEKLTPEELESLNAWIRARSLATLDAPRYGTTPSMGSAQLSKSDIKKMERETIVSRINGKFSGWDGQTIFRLENGMIWAQDDKDKFYTQEMQNPTVTIEPTLFGGWKLSVEGFDEACDVERIQ
ncbi:MAG: hypothetical protein R3212_01110 [Xanthomonadales bacterium]|nr:hypothetical protein [Xanthomonadales bacterium]